MPDVPESEPKRIGVSFEFKPHAYDPITMPEIFEGVLARRALAFVIDVVVIVVPIMLAATFIFIVGLLTFGLANCTVDTGIPNPLAYLELAIINELLPPDAGQPLHPRLPAQQGEHETDAVDRVRDRDAGEVHAVVAGVGPGPEQRAAHAGHGQPEHGHRPEPGQVALAVREADP